MNKGYLRTKIADECPEGFEETLKDWIDDLEQSIGDILGDLEINSIGDLGKIEDARCALDDLHDGLY
jgi:hypothetical protein